MTLATRLKDYQSALAIALPPAKGNDVVRKLLAERTADCLLEVAEFVGHIRKSETACTIACPACRLRQKIREAL